jgi:hypothetical protein
MFLPLFFYKTFSPCENRIPEARIGNFSEYPAPAALAGRSRFGKCPAREEILFSRISYPG